MILSDLWERSRDELLQKQLHQIIAIAGEGKLRDGSTASLEFRRFLSHVPSDRLSAYAEECLTDSFTDSGLALQDLVNQVGTRLGLMVEPGRYRSGKNAVSHVGRNDTGELEAQIRGSRHAWDVRLISLDALLRLLTLKQTLEDPGTVAKIHKILIPEEYTRLDGIVDLVFSAAEEAKAEIEDVGEPESGSIDNKEPKFHPVAFHDDCIAWVERHLSTTLVKRTRAGYSTPDNETAVVCAVSKEHKRSSGARSYWFAFHPHQRQWLSQAKAAYLALGCGSAKQTMLLPFSDVEALLPDMWTTTRADRTYWHVRLNLSGKTYTLSLRKGTKNPDMTKFMPPSGVSEAT